MQVTFKRAGSRAAVTTLAELPEDQQATLDRIELPEEFAGRLMELGFIPGAIISAAKAAPGGDPRVFRVDGSEIALRRETAQRLMLRPPRES